MNRPSSAASSGADRRSSPRHYLARPMQAELIYGRQRIAIESGRISNISQEGIGLRSSAPVKLVPGAMVTVATRQGDQIVTASGTLKSIRYGVELGLTLCKHNPLFGMLGDKLGSATVSVPEKGLARLSGTIALSSRHPINWAIKGGAKVLNMTGVATIDSAGIGMLLMFNERDGLRIEKCLPEVCRLIKMCRPAALCAPDCQHATVPTPIGAKGLRTAS